MKQKGKYPKINVSKKAYDKIAARAKKEKRTIVSIIDLLLGV